MLFTLEVTRRFSKGKKHDLILLKERTFWLLGIKWLTWKQEWKNNDYKGQMIQT
jgi:hypothetical protein